MELGSARWDPGYDVMPFDSKAVDAQALLSRFLLAAEHLEFGLRNFAAEKIRAYPHFRES